jgi:zinc ribbon protein
MKIECPSCHLSGNINEREIPQGRNISCPRCKTSFRIEGPQADDDALFHMSICPECQYSTYTEETFTVCPKCGLSGKGFREKQRKQEVERIQADLEAVQRSFRNPNLIKPAAEEEQAQAALPQPVRMTGWSCIVVGAALFGYGMYGLADYYGKDWRAILSEPLLEPLSRTTVFFRLGFTPWLITLFSIGLMVVASQFLRLRPWAYRGLVNCAWTGLAVIVISEIIGYIEWVRLSSGTLSLSYHLVGIMTALLMMALWSIPVFAFHWVLGQEWITDEFPK